MVTCGSSSVVEVGVSMVVFCCLVVFALESFQPSSSGMDESVSVSSPDAWSSIVLLVLSSLTSTIFVVTSSVFIWLVSSSE